MSGEDDGWVPIDDAARMLGRGASTVRAMAARGELPRRREGRRTLYRVTEEASEESSETTDAPEAREAPSEASYVIRTLVGPHAAVLEILRSENDRLRRRVDELERREWAALERRSEELGALRQYLAAHGALDLDGQGEPSPWPEIAQQGLAALGNVVGALAAARQVPRAAEDSAQG